MISFLQASDDLKGLVFFLASWKVNNIWHMFSLLWTYSELALQSLDKSIDLVGSE